MNNQKIILKRTKKGSFITVLICIVFIIASLLVVLWGWFAIGLIGVIFFGVCLFLYVRTTNKVVLIVDETGFADYSTIFRFGFIPWNYVEALRLQNIVGTEVLIVELKHNQEVFSSLGKFKTWEIKSNHSMGLPSLVINVEATGITPHELFPQMNSFFEEFRTGESF